SGLIIFDSLVNLFARVHHEWTVTRHRFIQRHTANQQKFEWFSRVRGISDENLISVSREHHHLLRLRQLFFRAKQTRSGYNVNERVVTSRHGLRDFTAGRYREMQIHDRRYRLDHSARAECFTRDHSYRHQSVISRRRGNIRRRYLLITWP